MQQVCFYFEGSLPFVFVQFCGEGNIQHVIFQHPAKFRNPKAPMLEFVIWNTKVHYLGYGCLPLQGGFCFNFVVII